MVEVIVVGEGQTEATFVTDLLAPALGEKNVMVQRRLIATSRDGVGGALSRDRVVKFLRDTLLQRRDVYVTTLFDLYGLRPDFPGVRESAGTIDPLERAALIEALLANHVVREARCRAGRFIPHIQPHEFESLLFSDVARFPEIRSEWQAYLADLEAARDAAPSPEHINDGPDTHPSARLKRLLRPRYQKVLHGSQIAARIGLERIRAECAHFGAWLAKIEALPPLRAGA